MSDVLNEADREKEKRERNIDNGKCANCGVLVFFNATNKRNSPDGSFIDLDGGLKCPDGEPHQG